MSDIKQPSELFTAIVLEIFKVNGLLANEGDRITSEFGLSSARWKVLGALSLAQEPLTVSQIARNMGLTRQAVQRLADEMQKGGLLGFMDNPNHKRAKLVTVSAKGEQVYAQLDQIQRPWAQQHADAFSAEDLTTTLAVLTKISQRFTDDR